MNLFEKHAGLSLKKLAQWIWGLVTVGLFVNLAIVGVDEGFALTEQFGLAAFYFLLAVVIFFVVRAGSTLLKKKTLIHSLMVVCAIICSLILFELIMIPFDIVFSSSNRNVYNFDDRTAIMQVNELKKAALDMQRDDELGYRPNTGGDSLYDGHGAFKNEYSLEKAPGNTRVLFIGDSIAAIGYLSAAVKGLNQAGGYEYWNMGVHGYSTRQELKYFERYGRKLRPDIVILEFCLNDFDGTPVVLKDENGKTIVANLYLGEEHFNYWLYKHSTLYRLYLSLKASVSDRAGLVEDVRKNIKKMQQYAREDGFALRVVVYPLLLEYDQWPESYKTQRQDAVALLKDLGVEFYDANDFVQGQIKARSRDHVRLGRDDQFHPSKALAKDLAGQILDAGFLAAPQGEQTAKDDGTAAKGR